MIKKSKTIKILINQDALDVQTIFPIQVFSSKASTVVFSIMTLERLLKSMAKNQSENQFLQQEKLEFKHLCDDWREGSIGKKPLTSRCRPDVKKQRFYCCIQIDHFHFSYCRFSFLFLCFND